MYTQIFVTMSTLINPAPLSDIMYRIGEGQHQCILPGRKNTRRGQNQQL